MTREEVVVDGDVLHADGVRPSLDLHDAVHEKERVSVREQVHDVVDVHRSQEVLAHALGGRARLFSRRGGDDGRARSLRGFDLTRGRDAVVRDARSGDGLSGGGEHVVKTVFYSFERELAKVDSRESSCAAMDGSRMDRAPLRRFSSPAGLRGQDKGEKSVDGARGVDGAHRE